MRRSRLLVVLAVALVAAAMAGIVIWQETQGQLTYSVKALSGHRVEAKLADSRHGKHTDWIVLLGAPQGADRRLLNLFRDGGQGSGVPSSSTRLRLPAGVYRYSVYSVGRLYAPDDPRFWTAANRVAEGQVTLR